jgi:hypothetical protein
MRPEASYISLGPRQEAILRMIVPEPGGSMNRYIAPFRSRMGSQVSTFRLVELGLVIKGNGPRGSWELRPSALGVHWVDLPRQRCWRRLPALPPEPGVSAVVRARGRACH